MKKVLVTGSNGFIGKNLVQSLSRLKNIKLLTFDVENDPEDLIQLAGESDFIYHLAGVNRPEYNEQFMQGNFTLTDMLITGLLKKKKTPAVILSSSIQAALDNPYGISKSRAEDSIARYSAQSGAASYIFRLPNVFGKWCRPNYNSVVATFCHNISHGLDITVSDPEKELALVYIDDVIKAFIEILSLESKELVDNMENRQVIKEDESMMVLAKGGFYGIRRVFTTTLGGLADKIYQLRDIRKTLVLPDLSDEFMRCLHSTYISYLDKNDLSYAADMKTDARGSLFELIRSEQMGQIFISRSFENITRGNHYHDSKVEKFCLIQGEAEIRLRSILSDEVITYHVSGSKVKIVDIPPGYTHSIENTGDGEMIVIFWSSRLFDQNNPDTYYENVLRGEV